MDCEKCGTEMIEVEGTFYYECPNCKNWIYYVSMVRL